MFIPFHARFTHKFVLNFLGYTFLSVRHVAKSRTIGAGAPAAKSFLALGCKCMYWQQLLELMEM